MLMPAAWPPCSCVCPTRGVPSVSLLPTHHPRRPGRGGPQGARRCLSSGQAFPATWPGLSSEPPGPHLGTEGVAGCPGALLGPPPCLPTSGYASPSSKLCPVTTPLPFSFSNTSLLLPQHVATSGPLHRYPFAWKASSQIYPQLDPYHLWPKSNVTFPAPCGTGRAALTRAKNSSRPERAPSLGRQAEPSGHTRSSPLPTIQQRWSGLYFVLGAFTDPLEVECGVGAGGRILRLRGEPWSK